MLAAISALVPLILKLLGLFFTDKTSEAQQKLAIEEAKAALQDAIRRTRAAIDYAAESGGDTSLIEDVINKRPKK